MLNYSLTKLSSQSFTRTQSGTARDNNFGNFWDLFGKILSPKQTDMDILNFQLFSNYFKMFVNSNECTIMHRWWIFLVFIVRLISCAAQNIFFFVSTGSEYCARKRQHRWAQTRHTTSTPVRICVKGVSMARTKLFAGYTSIGHKRMPNSLTTRSPTPSTPSWPSSPKTFGTLWAVKNVTWNYCLPLSCRLQFGSFMNVYFLAIACLQLISILAAVSPSMCHLSLFHPSWMPSSRCYRDIVAQTNYFSFFFAKNTKKSCDMQQRTQLSPHTQPLKH